MLLDEVITEYLYDCKAKNFTVKTMKNKRLELKDFKIFIEEKRAITELEPITLHDVQAYLRYKQNQGLQPQIVVSLYKMVRASYTGVSMIPPFLCGIVSCWWHMIDIYFLSRLWDISGSLRKLT